MPEKDIKCCVCQKQFSAVYNLAKHARKYHPEQVNLVIPKKKNYNYQCTQCHRNFSHLKNFNYHKKRHNNENLHSDTSPASKHTNAECPICKFAAPKEKLIPHFEVEHDIKCVTQTIEFFSFEDFSAWKTGMEHDTKSKYVVERGSQSNKDGTRIIKYCCHRSGKYVASGKGLRHLKSQGSNKIGGFCPARLKLIINKNNQCKVFFMNQHVGHNEVANTKDVKNKLLRGKQKPIDDFCPARLKLIINKNNQCKMSFMDQHVGHNEVANAEDVENKLIREKQKLSDNFTQLLESVTCMEQLDAVKKAFISLGPILEAIATKRKLGKPCTPISSSSHSNNEVNYISGRKKSLKAVALVTPTNEMHAIAM